MKRRQFVQLLGSALFTPLVEPASGGTWVTNEYLKPPRAYSFVGGWAINYLDDVCTGDPILQTPYHVRGTDLALRFDSVRGLTFTMLDTKRYVEAAPHVNHLVRSSIYGRLNDLATLQEMCAVIRRADVWIKKIDRSISEALLRTHVAPTGELHVPRLGLSDSR